ncbi:MAG TPA: Cof-type HAD-IIB family hydrolase, partial [Candidatus Limiplasma sp.]|nr:Cof-type HAD-IIB family hydrolase [Candidatus Limiplasma sp.]
MKLIRLIVLDMDGTLLNANEQIPEENLRALKAAEARGVHIAFCSGRNATDLSYFASDATLNRCHILSLNGACCLDVPHSLPYEIHTFAPSVADRLTETLLKHQVTFACFQQNRVIVLKNDPRVDKRNWGTHVARDHADAYLYGEEALALYKAEGVCKAVYIAAEASPLLEQIRRELASIEGLCVTSSWGNNLEIMPTGVGKGSALAGLAHRLGLSREEVMAIGDYDNDLDMIRYAGFGVAMGNGS